MQRIIVVDVETTGLSVQRGGRVIEVGAVAMANGIITGEFNTLIDTGTAISYGAYRVHGISEAMLMGKPMPCEVWPMFKDFAGDGLMVAHNASFDSSFVCQEISRTGLYLANDWRCTLRLARKYLPVLPNHRLDTVYSHLFGALPSGVQRHRALDDARMTARMFINLVEMEAKGYVGRISK